MNAQEFVEAIKVIMHAGVSGLIKGIENPPGREPRHKLMRISEFYNGLTEEDRRTFQDALEMAAEDGFSSMLLILDGALAIEDGMKGQLELYYSDGTKRIRLNDPDEQDYLLNELFRVED